MAACASLAMYDLPELTSATDAWWHGLAAAFGRAGLKDVPQRLDRGRAPGAILRDPGLLLGQTCGYPLMYELRGVVRLVATPDYDAPGCDGACYSSAIVVREEDTYADLAALAGRTCAFNGGNSQSGYNAMRRAVAAHAKGRTFFRQVIETGGHANSLAAVAKGEADVAAIDGVTHALLSRACPELLNGLRVLAWTPQAPSLPYVTSGGADGDRVERLRDGLRMAVADPALAAARQTLLLRDFAFLPISSYGAITEMAEEAADLGYPELV